MYILGVNLSCPSYNVCLALCLFLFLAFVIINFKLTFDAHHIQQI